MIVPLTTVSAIVYSHGIVVFFFFQAEDGIRDLTVTGVQTCALPICSCHTPIAALAEAAAGEAAAGEAAGGDRLRLRALIALPDGSAVERSEERRVGKECRSRWSPYH